MSLDIIEEVIKPSLLIFNISEVDDNTQILGRLDSLALVTLIGTVEEIIQEKTGEGISLLSADAFSRSRSPFKNVGALAAYIQTILESAHE